MGMEHGTRGFPVTRERAGTVISTSKGEVYMAGMELRPDFQKDNYIHPKAAWDKLRAAGARRQNVYIYAATGYGKTEMLHRYLRRRRHIWLSGEGLTAQTLQEMLLPENGILVIDDLARVLDPAARQEVLALLEQGSVWVVMAGRCPLPSWLTRPYINGHLSVIPEEDLSLSGDDIAQLYLSWGVQLPRKLLEKKIIPLVEGNPLGARLLAMEMSRGAAYTEELLDDLTRKFYEYLNQAIYSEWPEEIRDVMMQLALLEHFTMAQAETMTGRSDVNRVLARAAETGNLFTVKDGVFTLRPTVIHSMRLRMETAYDRAQKDELFRRAGVVSEKEGDIPRALELYQQGHCKEEVKALLVDNARRYPGGGYYYELTPAYLALPEEEVCASPDLIAALSMLYSLALNATESERWYGVLQAYADTHPEPEEHRLAESWLVYLDISLPHRGNADLIEVLERSAQKIRDDHLTMPEFSVTGGQPSVINGSKDFCDWTKNDQEMALLLEQYAAGVLGRYAKGLVNLGLAESLFEKGGDIYKVLELANRGLMETMDGGKFELQFVGAALVARVYLVTGHLSDSIKTLEDVEDHAQQRGALRVVRNVRAMQCRVKLWQGRVEDAARWMDTEPQNEIHFNVVERYCYNTYVRVYMAQQRYDKAALILTRLRSYASMEKRPWLQMESDLLECIIRYRTGNPMWRAELTQVLRRAEEYHFVRLFCREGAALLPLLQEMGCPAGLDEAFWQEVLDKTSTMAEAYPLYLTVHAPTVQPGAVQLSERGLQVLRLQAKGLTRAEIAQQLQLSERSVKYQSEQAYHKLGTNNKVEALAQAWKLNLL